MKTKQKGGALRRILLISGIVVLVIAAAVGGLFGYLTLTEYRPADRESIEVAKTEGRTAEIAAGDTIRLLTWNTGYGALGDNADFFMDGGTMVQTAELTRVTENITEIRDEILKLDPDAAFLQEVDVDSARSYHIDEAELYRTTIPDRDSAFATNYKVAFIPYPVPPIGKVNGGILTLSKYAVSEAERVQLPCPFSWPVRLGNLKRCLLISRIPVEGSDRELVLINLHLEAYDDGEGKAAQTEMLRDILDEEAAAGNYVIAGGDFNQIFSSADTDAYPAQEGKWAAGEIDVTAFSDGWQFLMDASVPSCRSLDQPFAGVDRDTFQYYLIDGFIVSQNVSVTSCEGIQLDFVNTDHNPVLLTAQLK